MREYSVNLYTKNQAKLNQVKAFIRLADNLGYIFKHERDYISAKEAIDILLNIYLGTINFVKNDQEYFDVYLVNGCLKLCTIFCEVKVSRI